MEGTTRATRAPISVTKQLYLVSQNARGDGADGGDGHSMHIEVSEDPGADVHNDDDQGETAVTGAEITVGVDDGSDDADDGNISEDDEEEKKVAARETTETDGVLSIQCGDNEAEFHVSKFARGSRGACILYKSEWITPNDFQYISGRESCKDWKRSIRYQGRPMKQAVAHGLLKVHALDCSCKLCQNAPAPANQRVKEEKRRRLNPNHVSSKPVGSTPANGHTHGASRIKVETAPANEKRRKPRTWTLAPFPTSTPALADTTPAIRAPASAKASSMASHLAFSSEEELPVSKPNRSDPEWSPRHSAPLPAKRRRRTTTPLGAGQAAYVSDHTEVNGYHSAEPKRVRRAVKAPEYRDANTPLKRGQFTDGYSPQPNDVAKWTVQQVVDFVTNEGFAVYAHRFKEEEIDGIALLDIREDHLLDRIQMRLGSSLRLFRLIRQIQCP
ncbi:uncharacterized protein LOC135814955 [Sycon ciliatum]|uniref:uncharacterized protein LOC135814955 n=1 Tax=Sycon ciliatum TaxID=27933 RepID=UPI0031F6DD7C